MRLRGRLQALLFALPLLGASGLASCRATERFENPVRSELARAEPLPITLARGLRGWKETSTSLGAKKSFRLGSLFKRLFPAHDGRAFLSPVEASLETNWSSRTDTWESHYTFTLTLQLDGRRHEVHAAGRGESGSDPRGAERMAMEDCVCAIYTQVATLLHDGA